MRTCPTCNAKEGIVCHGLRGPKTRYLCKSCGKTFTVDETRLEDPGMEEAGNYATLNAVSEKGPLSPQDVMREFGFSEDEWLVEKARPGFHEMGYKGADGTGKKMTLWNMKVWLVRRVPIKCEWPAIRGADVRPWTPRARKVKRSLKRAVVVPDIHSGYRRDMDSGKLTPMHDLRACDIAAKVIRDQEPDLVVLLGDNLDLADWSDKFIKTPDCKFTTQAALNWLASWIASWRPFAGEVVYLEGNHEYRIPKLLASNCEAAYGLKPANLPDAPALLSVPSMLGLEELDVQWVPGYPKNFRWVNENLRARHADELARQPGHTVGKSLANARASSLFGHSHRAEAAHTTVHGFDKIRVYGAYSFGTLARLDEHGPPSGGKETNWQQCLGIVDYEEDGRNLFSAQQFMIYDGKCIVEGTLYETEVEL